LKRWIKSREISQFPGECHWSSVQRAGEGNYGGITLIDLTKWNLAVQVECDDQLFASPQALMVIRHLDASDQ
jgi:hypothetical protein